MKVLIMLACMVTVAYGDFVLQEEFEAQWDGTPYGLDCDDVNSLLLEVSQYTAIVYVHYGTWEWTGSNYYFPPEISHASFCVLGNSQSTYDMYLVDDVFGRLWVRQDDDWFQPDVDTYEESALDIDPDGTIWVTSGVWGMYHLSSDCDSILSQWYLPELTEVPNGLARFNYQGIEYLAVTSKDDHHIYVYTLDGQFVSSYNSPITGDYHTRDITFSEAHGWFFWSYYRYNGDGFIAKMTFDVLSLVQTTWGAVKVTNDAY